MPPAAAPPQHRHQENLQRALATSPASGPQCGHEQHVENDGEDAASGLAWGPEKLEMEGSRICLYLGTPLLDCYLHGSHWSVNVITASVA